MKEIRIIKLFAVMLVILQTTFAYSQDWPQFRGATRDSKVTAFKAPATWPVSLTQVWKVSVGTGDATPVLSGKKIYLNTRQGSEEVVLCLDAASGKELWKYTYQAAAVNGPAASHPGPRSTPAIANGKIVTFGATGILTCLNPETGKLIWKNEDFKDVVPQFFTGMSPLISDGICIAHIGTTNKGEIIALDLNTGNAKWKWIGDGPSYASPSIMTIEGKKYIIAQTEKNLVALDFANGKLMWQVATAPAQRFYNSVSPYIDGNRIYLTGQGTGTKAVEILKQGDKFTTKELWSNTEAGAKWNTPVLKNGFLYGFTDQRRIYCINAATGTTGWIDNTVNSDFATIVDCGSILLGSPSTGSLIFFKPDPEKYSEVAKYKVSETPVYAFPVVTGNLVYVKDAESLILFKIN